MIYYAQHTHHTKALYVAIATVLVSTIIIVHCFLLILQYILHYLVRSKASNMNHRNEALLILLIQQIICITGSTHGVIYCSKYAIKLYGKILILHIATVS